MQKIARILLTSGEPAGIGPEQIAQLAQKNWPIEWVVIGDTDLIQARAQQIGCPIHCQNFDATLPPTANQKGQVKVWHLPLKAPAKAGVLNMDNAHYVLEMLTLATQSCLNNSFDALVTAPIHKGIINEAGIKFSGHTEFLADKSDTETVVMMLATPGLRVPLVTTHLPLRDIADAITPALLSQVIRITYQSLQQQFGIKQPKLYIAGINPHAGEDGHLGREEIEVMQPVLQQLRAEGMNLIGPLPADTIFTPHYMKDADAMLAMYHDQGLPVLKHVGFGKAVNVTLGLPFIRTSVDHGTALDLAGTGKASVSSFEYAIDVALEMMQGKTHAA